MPQSNAPSSIPRAIPSAPSPMPFGVSGHQLARPFRARLRFRPIPRALPWAVIGRAFGATNPSLNGLKAWPNASLAVSRTQTTPNPCVTQPMHNQTPTVFSAPMARPWAGMVRTFGARTPTDPPTGAVNHGIFNDHHFSILGIARQAFWAAIEECFVHRNHPSGEPRGDCSKRLWGSYEAFECEVGVEISGGSFLLLRFSSAPI
jgi:hypothetical protein